MDLPARQPSERTWSSRAELGMEICFVPSQCICIYLEIFVPDSCSLKDLGRFVARLYVGVVESAD